MTNADKPEPVALKSCPFCGGKAECDEYWPSWDTREWQVYCYAECGAAVRRKTNAEAIAVWNTRPTSDLAERIEGLVEEIVRAAREADSATEAEDTVATILAALKEVNSHDRT